MQKRGTPLLSPWVPAATSVLATIVVGDVATGKDFVGWCGRNSLRGIWLVLNSSFLLFCPCSLLVVAWGKKEFCNGGCSVAVLSFFPLLCRLFFLCCVSPPHGQEKGASPPSWPCSLATVFWKDDEPPAVDVMVCQLQEYKDSTPSSVISTMEKMPNKLTWKFHQLREAMSYSPPVWAHISAIDSRHPLTQERGYTRYTPWGTQWFFTCGTMERAWWSGMENPRGTGRGTAG